MPVGSTVSSQPLPIVAIATGPGKGGIGIIRLSGTALDTFIVALLGRSLPARRASLIALRDGQGEIIDECLALYFPAPGSYTGEDVLELQGHGGQVVLGQVLKRCLELGAAMGLRLAEPGEFTLRAYLNHRLDLAQAEAVADLIDAGSEAAARGAMRSLTGAFSAAVHTLVERLTELRALVEASLDFPEEDLEFIERYEVRQRLDTLAQAQRQLNHDAHQGLVLRNGLHVVLAGAPNVGKSSLLNALAGDDIAIVTPFAGTTRDRILQTIHIDGVPLHLIDTAGLRATEDPIEQLGIARTWAELARADVVIEMLEDRLHDQTLLHSSLPYQAPPDASPATAASPDQSTATSAGDSLTNPTASDPSLWQSQLPRAVQHLQVINKIDQTRRPAARQQSGTGAQAQPLTQIYLSALTGEGIDLLRTELLRCAGRSPGEETLFLARERHMAALLQSDTHIQQAQQCLGQGKDVALDLLAEELRLAQTSLAAITGEVLADDLLGQIFSRFCIGK